jgi:hypothetical protein
VPSWFPFSELTILPKHWRERLSASVQRNDLVTAPSELAVGFASLVAEFDLRDTNHFVRYRLGQHSTPQPTWLADQARGKSVGSFGTPRPQSVVNAFWQRRPWREPDAGNLHVRFDEEEGSGGHWSSAFHSVLSSLLHCDPRTVALSNLKSSPHSTWLKFQV